MDEPARGIEFEDVALDEDRADLGATSSRRDPRTQFEWTPAPKSYLRLISGVVIASQRRSGVGLWISKTFSTILRSLFQFDELGMAGQTIPGRNGRVAMANRSPSWSSSARSSTVVSAAAHPWQNNCQPSCT